MIATHATPADDTDLDALLSSLDFQEPEDLTLHAEEIIGETDLEAAVLSCESQDVINEHYAAEEEVEVVAPEPIDPMNDPSVLLSNAPIVPTPGAVFSPPAVVPEKKAKTPKAPKEPKVKTAPVRKHFASKSERVADHLGADLGSYTVLELQDAVLEGAELAAKQAETMDALKGASVKVSGRMACIMEFAAGKSASLNSIAATALTMLKTEGKIITGESGNLHLELVKKYSKGSASAMANSTLGALRTLKVIVLGVKGEYVANPNSLYLLKLNSMIGL